METTIILNPLGSGGDVFPFIPIGIEFQNRGFNVEFLTNPIFEKRVSQAGLKFTPIGSEARLRSVGQSTELQQPQSAWRLALEWGVLGTLQESFAKISKIVNKPNNRSLIVSSFLSFGAKFVSERYGVPHATLLLSPYVLRSLHESSVMSPLLLNDWVPKFAKRLQYWMADQYAIDPCIAPKLNQFRKQIGLEPVHRFLNQWRFADQLNLCVFPESFAARQNDWPDRLQFMGDVHWDPVATKVPQVENFFKTDRPVITVMMGSAGSPSPKFYSNLENACAQLNRRLLILEPNPRMRPNSSSKEVMHAFYYPLNFIADKSELVIHSGAIGASLRTLRSGTPQLVIPRVNDQFDNASRLRKLGVARTMWASMLAVEQLVETVKEATSSQVVEAAKKHSLSLERENAGLSVACDLLEKELAIQTGMKEQLPIKSRGFPALDYPNQTDSQNQNNN